ncbi:hypothetical protein SAMN05216184_101811 [Georgenia satyanarayanai]|uniref:Lysine-specific metallo-endopeptidase n=1 Tax=Georgenia satyanarayanai TaxID=860221 RepID=A0A2Y8ZY07_9MICO|nr:hypothetical protein A8987_101811 [Georgenia satyanarayanai]SSA37211.1 hypothetical protein SAMN05216184_101811 [Georgenia satyanarayanai]
MLGLQRAAGNRAVTDLLGRPPAQGTVTVPPSPGVDLPVVAARGRSDVRFRVPTFSDLKAAYTSPGTKVAAGTIEKAVTQLLGRMAREKRLKSTDPVADIVKRIFPAPGTIVEAEFTKALDVADRSVIYQSVLDADTTVKAVDTAKLTAAISDAQALVSKAEGNATGLKEVFGAKAGAAKTIYAKARTSLGEVAADMAKHVSTDYNLDDPEVFLGGWASHGARHMHLLVGVVKVVDPKGTKSTLIHEAAHLADPSVDDHGYYGSPGFEALDETTKVGNAAHFEELPRRELATSSYAGLTFTPGVAKGGAALTWEDTIRRRASEHLRKAWDAAVDVHMWLRGVRRAALGGDRTPFTTERALIMTVSRLMDLTVHQQTGPVPEISAVDVTLTESIARAMQLIKQIAGRETPQRPMGPFLHPGDEDVFATHVLIEAGISGYGQLLGNATRDRDLVDWLVAHYRSLPAAP